jgi:hypothetical protein
MASKTVTEKREFLEHALLFDVQPGQGPGSVMLIFYAIANGVFVRN